jgi:hypothetical protein
MKNVKTPEDEAFDELARKQGAWGGGFTSKRQAAMDKINSEFHEEYIKYRTAFPKEYTAPQPAQEPVAWMWDVNNGGGYTSRNVGLHQTDIPFAKHTPLYTAPPQRPWVGLTREEFEECYESISEPMDDWALGLAIEAKLKDKNT